MFSIIILFFLYVNFISSVSNAKLIGCDEIVKNYVLSNSGDIGKKWEHYDLMDNIKKNVLCGVVYLDSDKIMLVDKQNGLLIGNKNIHFTNTTPHLKEEIIMLMKKFKIPFYINNNFPVHSWFYLLRTYSLKIVLYMLWLYFYYQGRQFIFDTLFGKHSFYSQKRENKKDDDEKIMFDDVAGCEEAKYELQEIVEFLKDSDQFTKIGAKIPKGVLLEGPPGTGKTLLAKATSNEANVNFIYASGSQFIEMYVGVGAQRVRKLFDTAQKMKPCIVFIDEIDAIGKKRSNGFESNSEQDQTINQLLTIMDGFEENEDVIVMGATNRVDILDNALTRNGRFDRKIKINLPDRQGRKQILKVHLKGKNVDKHLDLEPVYELTVGMTGAQLANLVNEACILSVRYKLKKLTQKCFIDAFEKITIGLPKQVDNRPKENIKMVAYHEAGHAIGALFFNEMYDLRRVTINANNTGAGGYTLFTPKEEFAQFPTKRFMLSNIIISLGGRAAEMLFLETKEQMEIDKAIFKNQNHLNITTGASNDLKQAFELARNYVATYGLGDHIGLYDYDENSYFANKLSESAKTRIDKEVEHIIKTSLNAILKIIEENRDQLDKIAELLLYFQTISYDQIKDHIFMNKDFIIYNS